MVYNWFPNSYFWFWDFSTLVLWSYSQNVFELFTECFSLGFSVSLHLIQTSVYRPLCTALCIRSEVRDAPLWAGMSWLAHVCCPGWRLLHCSLCQTWSSCSHRVSSVSSQSQCQITPPKNRSILNLVVQMSLWVEFVRKEGEAEQRLCLLGAGSTGRGTQRNHNPQEVKMQKLICILLQGDCSGNHHTAAAPQKSLCLVITLPQTGSAGALAKQLSYRHRITES